MSKKVLKDHAFVFCQMFMGWRMQQDLGTFAELPDGLLQIDVLSGTCTHTDAGSVTTHIAGELNAWFLDRLNKHGIPATDIETAMLHVIMKNTIASKHKMGIAFDWTCDSKIVTTEGREFTAHLAEPHTWIPMLNQRGSAG